MLKMSRCKSRRFLSAPTAFLWNQRLPRIELESDDGLKVFAHQRNPVTEQPPWEIIRRLASRHHILMKNDGIQTCDQFSAFLTSINVDRLVFHERKQGSASPKV
jgi:hypothetical protein